MTARHPLLSALGATLLGASFLASCATPSSPGTPGAGGATGAAGSNPQGAAGSNPQGAAGSNPQGAAGSSPQGAAGSNPQGTAGRGGTTGAAGSNPQGAAGSGGSNPQGVAGTTGTAGSNPQGAAGAQGTAGRGGTTGAAGSNPQGVAGTTGTAGTTGGGGSGNPNCPLASANIISDFEEGTTAVTVKPTGGIWYAYKGMGTITPAPVGASTTPMGIATATDGTGTCKGALHVVASGATDYSGFGATFAPMPTSSQTQFAKPYDVSAHKGISFKIKSGSGTPSAIYLGFKTRETAPMAEGGLLSDAAPGSGNPDTSIGLRNNRGQILVTPWTSPAISTSWQTITIPFASLVSRWVPAAGSSNACPAPGTGVAKCQAPKFNPANVLALEFGVFPDPGFPKPATVGTYDVWVDDVQFVDDDSAGIATTSGFPLSGAGSPGAMCTKPNGYDGKPVDGKYLVSAYNQWKTTFVQGGKVIRPENGNDTVSEGIAYGMLLAVNFNDKTTFDSLYSYWKGHKATGGTPGLMTWCITNGGSNNCSSSGGSATDADEDAAFALLQAGKVFGTASYTTDAKSMISDIWANDIDTASNIPKGGNQYSRINPSYFAPAYYRIFATQDSGHNWGAVADKVVSLVNGSIAGTYGLLPAWCNAGCTGPDGSGNDVLYQYDSHRIPMRIGLDYCWNGTAAAKTYVDKITSFFATNAQAGKDGIGRISDLYNTSGSAASGSAPNSASIIGTAAVGAMASGTQKAWLDDAYQAVFDMTTRATMAPPDSSGKTPYSYYNATVGLLTLLMMTGNFSH